MELKRKNKEYMMPSINGVSVKYGTTDKTNPQVVYITGKTWVKPTKKIDFHESIGDIRKRMEKRILNRLKTVDGMDNKYIFDLDINPLNMKVGNSKFMTFNIFLRQNKGNVRSLKNVGGLLNVAFLPLIEEMTDDFNRDYFELIPKKSKRENEEKS